MARDQGASGLLGKAFIEGKRQAAKHNEPP